MSLSSICDKVVNMEKKRPSKKAVWNAVQRCDAVYGTGTTPASGYKNCGRKQSLTVEQQQEVIKFMKTWRQKRFCTCQYIAQSLKLKVDRKTIANVLRRHGFRWQQLPKIRGLTPAELDKRKAFVNEFGGKSPGWWQDNMQLILDGVTLTKAPKPLTARQRHMAQGIKAMWLASGEQHDNAMHTYNRYGVQLGQKVPLWGGFTGEGKFTLRQWTPRPKMTKQDWVQILPHVSRAAHSNRHTRPGCAKVWQDSERFLCQPDEYKVHGLQIQRFPPNSGDLNPIETVWAWLRRDLAKREQSDYMADKEISLKQFKQRAAHLLQGCGEKKPGEVHSRLEKFVRGMPRRLRQCKEHNYGRCGK